MRHLWTMITTVNTVTHDAGEPEWLDLPMSDYVLPASANLHALPLEHKLDPEWLIRSKWLIDEVDVGVPLAPIIEYRDPLGVTLYNQVPNLSSLEYAVISREYTTVPIVLDLSWTYIWYTLPGLYTFIIRWTGSRATRETGQFALNITDVGSGASHE